VMRADVRAGMRAVCVGLGVAAGLIGCAGAANTPPYTQAELRAQCQRQTGYWKADDLRGDGFCEFRGP
jgi:hypothetical protein